MSKYVIIDERGELFLNDAENRISDPQVAKQILQNLKLNSDFSLSTSINNENYLVEAFDFPLVGHAIHFTNEKILIYTESGLYFEAQAEAWSLDQKDQFCGLTSQGVPFRLTTKAQEQLFSLCSKYDDDSFTLGKKKYATPSYYIPNKEINTASFWSEIYQAESLPGWDLNQPAEAFKDMLPRLKLPKSRILVLGCGHGHDAALFAEAGHVVTAIDFSAEAIKTAKKRYGHLSNLSFEQMNIFDIPHEWNFTFDLVVEHTLFCAIDPTLREKLVSLWKRLLHEEGQLIAVFFTMFKRAGPPYGATESELRSLLQPYFQFLFWGRLRNSLPARMGRELFVLAKKR